MKKHILSIASIIVLGSSIVSAQEPVKQVSGGVLNGKATALAKPQYPAAARAVKAEGAVSVQVLIDENGNIESATAVSGHPLLRQAAETAARESKFSPTMLQGQPIKVSGIIVYNFIGDMNWLQVGYNLTKAENTDTSATDIRAGAIRSKIPAEWTAERELAVTLMNGSKANSAAPVQPNPTQELTEKSKVKVIQGESNATGGTLRAEIFAPSAGRQTFVSKEIASELKTSLQNRLSGDEVSKWHFSLGSALAAADFENEAKTRNLISTLNDLRESAPANAPLSVKETLEKFRDFSQKTEFNEAEKLKIQALINQILRTNL